MERWSVAQEKHIEVPEIDVFIEEIKAVCEKHNMSISHEDNGGAFEITEYSTENIRWLSGAYDARQPFKRAWKLGNSPNCD